MRRLGITHAILNLLDPCLNVAVGDKNIRPAIQIVIEEKTAEAESEQARTANAGRRGFVHEESILLVVIKRSHLIGKIGDQQARKYAAIVIRSIHSHARARNPVLAERHARSYALLGESSVAIVDIKFIWLLVVDEENVRPTVLIRVQNFNAEPLRSGNEKPGLLRGILESAVAAIVPKTHRRPAIRFRRAVRFRFSIKRAVDIRLR